MPTRVSLIVAVTIGLLLSTSAQADIINVPGDQPTIQAGIDAASDGDEVVVAPGTYNEVINFNDKAITLRSSDGADVTTIDGTDLDSSVVKCVSGEGTNTVLDGFTITGGTGTLTGLGLLGGGMFNNNSSSPTVSRCSFIGNSAAQSGGGMFNWTNSSPTVMDCNFIDNSTSASGGGMHNTAGSNPDVRNCTFTGNTAVDFGGAVYVQSAIGGRFANCVFNENTAGAGGGMGYREGAPILVNCTFSLNTAIGGGIGEATEPNGGGLFDRQLSIPTLANCVVWNNSDGGGTDESAQIYVTSGTTTVNHSCVQGWTGDLGGAGNIGDDPLFADPDNDDFHISIDSPAINVGDNSVVEADDVDMDGEERIQDGIVDMGADEFTFCLGDINGDGEIGPIDLAMLLAAWGPCPEPPADCPADIHGDGDGIVQADDLATLLGAWGSCD